MKIIDETYDINNWMGWRKTRLWTLDVNDLLETNKAGLTKVYKSFFQERKPFMNRQDALDLVIWQTSLAVPDKEALNCYGLCKMTCNNDILDRDPYDKL